MEVVTDVSISEYNLAIIVKRQSSKRILNLSKDSSRNYNNQDHGENLQGDLPVDISFTQVVKLSHDHTEEHSPHVPGYSNENVVLVEHIHVINRNSDDGHNNNEIQNGFIS